MKNKSKKFGSPFNDINIMSNNNPRSNNFIKRGNKNNYDRFNINNYDSSKPIKLLQPGHRKSVSTDKPSKKHNNNMNNNNYLYNQQYIIKPQTKIRNSVDLKRPSTAPQKYKISKNKGNKKSRSSNKNNNNIIPFIEYNQNNNIITNFMLNHNNNQKLFVKFNKEIQRGRGDNNNIINNNNQFIQNNNYININYYPQPNESK